MKGTVQSKRIRPRARMGAALLAVAALSHAGPSARAQNAATVPPRETPTRIYADSFLAWIYQRPERDPAPIGVLRAGQSVLLRSEGSKQAGEPIKKGCGRGWFAVEPAGYMCLDHTASLAPTRYSKSMAALLPDTGAYPFEFALSMGTPSYRRLPTPAEWQRKERVFGIAKRHELPPHWRGHEELAQNPPLPIQAALPFLENSGSVARAQERRLLRRDVPFGSMLAIKAAFEHEGRAFGQSADGTIVPLDRMVVFKRSEFEGVELHESAKFGLPLGWPKTSTRLFSLEPSAHCLPEVSQPLEQGHLPERAIRVDPTCLMAEETFAEPRQPLNLSGKLIEVAGTRFVEEISSKKWLPLEYLYLAERAKAPRGIDTEKAERWIEFSISRGTLTAYAGERPVFSTLASPGIGGTPPIGVDPLSTRTTPVGSFRITFKYRSDDMSPEQTEHRKFWIADVPHAMYFSQPFAIHVAYWHESFGEPMSGGCINVSPKDGARLFNWTEPQVPDDWYGVGSSPALGLGTQIIVKR